MELQVGDHVLLRTGDLHAFLRWEKVTRGTMRDHTFYLKRGFIALVHRPTPEGFVQVWPEVKDA